MAQTKLKLKHVAVTICFYSIITQHLCDSKIYINIFFYWSFPFRINPNVTGTQHPSVGDKDKVI